jgi:tight adherence protein B
MASAGLALRELVSLLRSGVSPDAGRQTVALELAELSEAQSERFEKVWQLARHVGSAPAVALERLASVFESQEQTKRQIETAFAAPKATARLVGVLPLIALVFAQLASLNPMAIITGSTVGTLSFGFGLLLLVAGQRWSNRLILKAQPSDIDPGSYLDAINLGLQSGLAPEAAINGAGNPSDAESKTLERALEISRETGAELGSIISATADRLRLVQQSEAETKVAKLGVSLMVPLGLTVLPAFVLVAIVPIALGMLSVGV